MVRELRQVPMQIDASRSIKNATVKILDAFVDSVFEFAHDHPLLPSQTNFAPVDELEEALLITDIEGNIPDNFQKGVYIRNGPIDPLFGGQKSTKSIFGRSSFIWVEGEGMLHDLYFTKEGDGSWNNNNRYVQTETFKLEKQRNKPSFLPAAEGDSPAILSAYLLNTLRYGKVKKEVSNTNSFKHSGKLYSIAENDIPQEIDIFTLKTCDNWDVNGSWQRPFTSHPKRAPDTAELVIMGVDAIKPFLEVGVVSADGKKLIHKVDVKLNRLIKYNGEEYARIGIMPRYGDSDSIQWFEVEPCCSLHIFKSFEDDGEVVVWGCRALDSIIPGPDMGVKNRYGYTQVVDSIASSTSGVEEDDGWIITFVHNEDSNTSQVYIIDANKFSCEPVAKITLPCRVPYGFHGAFMTI
ncbi:hypothetical protein FH972_001732 [Carpinus fangiana]|uniref:Uncharacterized protein n=1 Tax=Carpinus fangiana TaxID=176857 RepID=A0A5N6QD04_9ROSI|nr:hypothetical protein FH972_001732 [Carpinus fangiana]